MSRCIFPEKSLGRKFIAKAVSTRERKRERERDCCWLRVFRALRILRRAKVINSFVRVFYRPGIKRKHRVSTTMPYVTRIKRQGNQERKRRREGARVRRCSRPVKFYQDIRIQGRRPSCHCPCCRDLIYDDEVLNFVPSRSVKLCEYTKGIPSVCLSISFSFSFSFSIKEMVEQESLLDPLLNL